MQRHTARVKIPKSEPLTTNVENELREDSRVTVLEGEPFSPDSGDSNLLSSHVTVKTQLSSHDFSDLVHGIIEDDGMDTATTTIDINPN